MFVEVFCREPRTKDKSQSATGIEAQSSKYFVNKIFIPVVAAMLCAGG